MVIANVSMKMMKLHQSWFCQGSISKVYSREKCTWGEQLAGPTLLHEQLCCPYRKINLFKTVGQPETKMLQTGLLVRGPQNISDPVD